MIEFLTFLAGAAVLFGVGYGGFLAGRESAEARAHNTIANLRRANAGQRAKIDRLQESHTRLANALGDARVVAPDNPLWFGGRSD
jgi:hypothetical protein